MQISQQLLVTMASTPWTLTDLHDDEGPPVYKEKGRGKGRGKGKDKGKGKGKAKNPKASSAATAKRVKKDIAKPEDEEADATSQRWQFLLRVSFGRSMFLSIA